MSKKINNLITENQITNQETKENIMALIRALKRNRGFAIYFVRNPTQNNRDLISDILRNITEKNIREKCLLHSINSLYNEVKSIKDLQDTDILIISGLEQSILEYETQKFGYDSLSTNKDLSQDLTGFPRVIGETNLIRDAFRDNFPNLCLVFLLPDFTLNYFINRAPDFFDWRSGLFLLD